MSAQPNWSEDIVDVYFALEAASDLRYELINGVIYVKDGPRVTPGMSFDTMRAMAGASPTHVLLTTNFSGLLFTRLNRARCRQYVTDLRVATKRSYVYPDLVVVCGDARFEPRQGVDALLNPTLVIEVLSPSTMDHDRGDKFDLYRQIESVQEYLIVHQATARVEQFSRLPDGGWRFDAAVGLDDTLTLRSMAVSVPLRELYDGVTFPEPPETPPIG